ncbi:FUSC family protein [Microvirga roseola]|uniref:FUSC family protein n=1 Tax=Microvirga roseola TaxID=2883126 RepID=UPI001E30FAC0|nr:FUSC family protein [Microvirga roseola]
MQDILIKLKPGTLRESLRLGLQGAISAAATYLLMEWMGLAEMSWGVISALFVVQQSTDGTLTAASGRVGATAVGTVIGLASIQFIGGDFATALRLAASALVVNALAASWPGLRFGVVAAVAIALGPSANVWDGALDRGIAIMLGALIGTIVGFGVWPETARQKAIRSAQAALENCADLLQVALDETLDPRERELGAIHRRFLANVRQAHDMASRARLGRNNRPPLHEFVHALERLWHALIILDRVVQGDRRIDPAWSADMDSTIHCIQEEACAYLGEVARYLQEQGPAPTMEHLDKMIGMVEKLAAPAALAEPRENTPAAEDPLPVQALIFGLREVGRNLREIGRVLQ